MVGRSSRELLLNSGARSSGQHLATLFEAPATSRGLTAESRQSEYPEAIGHIERTATARTPPIILETRLCR